MRGLAVLRAYAHGNGKNDLQIGAYIRLSAPWLKAFLQWKSFLFTKQVGFEEEENIGMLDLKKDKPVHSKKRTNQIHAPVISSTLR